MNDKLVAFPKRQKGKKKCPICGRPPNPPTELFCSKRCADEDMRRWLGGEYRLPSAERPAFGADDDGSEPPKRG